LLNASEKQQRRARKARIAPGGRHGLAIASELRHKPLNDPPVPLRSMRLALLAALVMFSGAASAQALPNHIDPNARELVPNLAAVPAIRFLTTADFPPFNYRDEDSGELVGFNVDLARSLCDELKVTCTIQAWPWEQAAKALEDNQGDALIAGLALTPENGALFDFTSIYLALPGRFVARLDSAKDFDPLKLEGKSIAVRRGSTHAEFVRRYVPGVTVSEFDTEPAALDALRAGTADYYFGDALRASFWLNEHTDCCDFAGAPYFRPDLFGDGFSVAVPAGHDAVRLAIDYGLTRLKASGMLDELYLRWFPVSFY
jgi:polar amino acid transport system substrate-binding protein